MNTISQETFFEKTFNNQEELLTFLKSEKNEYSNFILKKFDEISQIPINQSLPSSALQSSRSQSAVKAEVTTSLDDVKKQKHHIQPKHASGPDEA
jgi:hypothetical protein